MKYLDEYRDPAAAHKLADEIRRRATRRWTIMEVCGGQTHSLLRHGIDEELEGAVELIHGPGCPVCVTPVELINLAQQIAMRDDCVLVSFGDMLRVPGTEQSLLDIRAQGGRVQGVYSPLDAVALAKRNTAQQVVFFAVGFETTAPATALAVKQADRLGLENLSLLVAHVRVQPAMEAILTSPHNRVQAFLAAGHVCTVMGWESYIDLAARYHVPIAVTGFEPVDLLAGVLECVRQLEAGQATVSNQYGRNVQQFGNVAAQALVNEVYEVHDLPWRGIGMLRQGGLALRPDWERFDAVKRFGLAESRLVEPGECRSGDVLAGRIRPPECLSFATRCTPERPLGAPMVSSEGACAAYFRYRAAAALRP
jgi:hydrogenase expression/formation protein HypD